MEQINLLLEEWRPIVGFDGYEVSNLGNVRSLDRIVKMKNGILRPTKGGIMSLFTHKGYKKVSFPIIENGVRVKKKCFGVHRLVAIAFIPNYDNKPAVNHINSNPSDNTLSNLEWCTNKENTQHAINSGSKLGPKPEFAFGVKLTREQASQIKKIGMSLPLKETAAMFGISFQTVWTIINGRSWKDA